MKLVYPSPIFGPIKSRRLGISLGVNIMPGDGKWCSFDCVYCECGLNRDHHPKEPLPTTEEVHDKLESTLKQMKERGERLDVITFSGNGEPTMHPMFSKIVDNVLSLRNEYYPEAKVTVLSNSTQIYRQDVFETLMKVDNALMKLDTVSDKYIHTVDQPVGNYNLQLIIDRLASMNGHAVIQTMFMKGEADGRSVDNTGDEYVLPWLETVKKIAPREVMIYTIDRETPQEGLKKATREELDRIVSLLDEAGIRASASY